jgi:hypothetical protein
VEGFFSVRLKVRPVRALTPHSAQIISPSGPSLKPDDNVLTVVYKFSFSSSSHDAEPFNAHSGQVTGVTNRSRFPIVASMPDVLARSPRTRPPPEVFLPGATDRPALAVIAKRVAALPRHGTVTVRAPG